MWKYKNLNNGKDYKDNNLFKVDICLSSFKMFRKCIIDLHNKLLNTDFNSIKHNKIGKKDNFKFDEVIMKIMIMSV